MKTFTSSIKFIIGLMTVLSYSSFAQKSQDWLLEKMPPDLETEYALSALPLRLRDQATVYLLDPKKGYYVSRQGTNGFSAYVNRTEWERAEFVKDTYAALGFDAEGSKTLLQAFIDIASMRATGKYTPTQLRDSAIKKVMDGRYKAPARSGVCYMLSPFHRTYDARGIVNNSVMPHYMFYAPRVDNKDMGGKFDGHSPFVVNSGDILDKEHSIFNYIIVPAGDTEKAKILEENNDFLRRLAEYKSNFKVKIEPNAGTHQH